MTVDADLYEARMSIRVWLIGIAAAILGAAVGYASSIGWSYAYARVLSVASAFQAETSDSIPVQGLAVAFEFVHTSRTATFERALFAAEQRVRARLAPQEHPTRWFIYRSRQLAADDTVLYVLWFEQHGDLERSALSDLFPMSAPYGLPGRLSEHAVLTLVPVASAR